MTITLSGRDMPKALGLLQKDFSSIINSANEGNTLPLATRMRALTAQLEKVMDTQELDDYPEQLDMIAERTYDSLHTYVEAVREDEIEIDGNYSIWALIAIRRYCMESEEDMVTYIEDILSEAILA